MSIYQDAINLLNDKEEFAFATIIKDVGSTPRSKGSKMIIKKDGSIFGTVGGGSMEAACINKAIKVIEEKKSLIYDFNLSNRDASKLAMICGGRGEIVIDYISPEDKNNYIVFDKALEASKQGKKGWIVGLYTNNNILNDRKLLFVNDSYKIYGHVIDNIYKTSLVNIINNKFNTENKSIRFTIDAVDTIGKAYIFGAGHVSKDVATILNLLEFKTIVIDDREEFANKKRFPQSDIVIIDSLENIKGLDIDNNSYILIITRGHMHDSNVLEWALDTDAYYIGMIGSKTKVNLTYEKLMKKGFSKEKLEKVHAPIGIKLKAQTPAEIAVSIAAELINYRAEKQNR